ncbi:MAG: hypothetical protein IH987_04315 [Planctomycetes bacterium]|nr:hypothetical protein [Planctomycetota bacterium]
MQLHKCGLVTCGGVWLHLQYDKCVVIGALVCSCTTILGKKDTFFLLISYSSRGMVAIATAGEGRVVAKAVFPIIVRRCTASVAYGQIDSGVIVRD